MPFPISIVGIIGIGTVTAVVGAIAHEDYSRYSEYSDYSDAAERRRREEEARQRKRQKDFCHAKEGMDDCVRKIFADLASKAGPEGKAAFGTIAFSADTLSYKNFSEEYNKLDANVQRAIDQAVAAAFAAEEQSQQRELDEVNALIRKISEVQLTEKKHD